MTGRKARTLMALMAIFSLSALQAQLYIASGLKGEIYHQFAIDIANNTDVPITVYSSQGSLDNYHKLTTDSNIQLAFMQYDVLLYQELENPDIKKNIKVLFPLYDEEIHLITRNNASINTLRDLSDKRIGMGSENSGTYITSRFIQSKTLLQWKAYAIPFQRCMRALMKDSIDAFFYVGAAPSNLLKSLSPNVESFIKLVPIQDKQLTDFYKKKIIKKGVYPWLKEDIKTLSVKSLIAVNTQHINPQRRAELDALYEDLKGNLQGIQKNKLSHPKWKDVDFTDMDGIEWPVYKEEYITMDFFAVVLAYLAALLSFIQIYFIINKLWKRKHERIVAESISISAMFISLAINGSFAFKNFHDGGYPQFSANLMWIAASITSALIGMGVWVADNRGISFFRLLLHALNLERKEAGDLALAFFRPGGADKILEILGRMAMIDEDLDEREKKLLQNFANHWNLHIDWQEIEKYAGEDGDKYSKIKQAFREYLKTSPQEEQIMQLRDMFNLLVNADEVVTEEEQTIMDELEGQIAEYLGKADQLETYRVAVVPQSKEQDEALSQLLKELKKEEIAGGYAYLSEEYYSERYAELLSAQYRALHVFSVVIKPKHMDDNEIIHKLLDKQKGANSVK